jgi:ATP-dependent DNA helicase DinG
MAQAVAAAIDERRHLIVQAGTGTGKSLAYLVPTVAKGQRVVVSTATKALQDQLATRDLPKLAEALAEHPVEFAVLKGRSNYVCRQRIAELAAGDEHDQQQDQQDDQHQDRQRHRQMALASAGQSPRVGSLGREVLRLVRWAEGGTSTGDRAELTWEPSDAAWSQVSLAARDCPGANRCPSGPVCFAEAARERAGVADVIVVNTHLYATALAAGADILPAHDIVVFDEAHELEDIASAAFGFDLGPGRLVALDRVTRAILDDPAPSTAVGEAAVALTDVLGPHIGRALPRPLGAAPRDRLVMIRERVGELQNAIRKALRSSGQSDELPDRARHLRAQQSTTHLLNDLDAVLNLGEDDVAWVEGMPHSPLLRVAPLDIGAALRDALWSKPEGPTAIMTSATIPPRLGERLGLPTGSYDQLDVGSPYSYDEQALLYCPLHLPDPRDPGFEEAMHDELLALMQAAGGRTLALFTSWRSMKAAADALRERVPWTILTQSDLPKPALLSRFSGDEHSCLFATMGFWQGVDVPGSALSLVTIDRLPFPRPDDPLLQARRAKLGRGAFEMIDVPRAATLLAQGVGRLIRSRSDRGVVAVFDTRLARARYRWMLINSLPPMRRTRHRSDVEDFLKPLRKSLSSRAAPTLSAGSASCDRP